MGNFSEINHDEIKNYGRIWALEGMDPNKFKGSPEEKIIFIEGYKAALQEQKASMEKKKEEEKEKGFGMAA